MKKYMSAIFTIATLVIYAQETVPKWTSGRPDGHAPISDMGGHMHGKGQWMFGYIFMNMDGLKNGSKNIDSNKAHDAGYMVVPQSMDMSIINDATNDMDFQMRMPTGMTNTFSTKASGLGGINISAIYKLYNKNRQEINAQLGLSIPTRAIDAKGLTPMSSPNEVVLPYPMPLGSGTIDPFLGLTYLGQKDLLSWGTQLKGVFRLGKNGHDYHLGTHLGLNSWLAIKPLG